MEGNYHHNGFESTGGHNGRAQALQKVRNKEGNFQDDTKECRNEDRQRRKKMMMTLALAQLNGLAFLKASHIPFHTNEGLSKNQVEDLPFSHNNTCMVI
jgi:hypothetical protein